MRRTQRPLASPRNRVRPWGNDVFGDDPLVRIRGQLRQPAPGHPSDAAYADPRFRPPDHGPCNRRVPVPGARAPDREPPGLRFPFIPIVRSLEQTSVQLAETIANQRIAGAGTRRRQRAASPWRQGSRSGRVAIAQSILARSRPWGIASRPPAVFEHRGPCRRDHRRAVLATVKMPMRTRAAPAGSPFALVVTPERSSTAIVQRPAASV
jgi:hypothetical protein